MCVFGCWFVTQPSIFHSLRITIRIKVHANWLWLALSVTVVLKFKTLASHFKTEREQIRLEDLETFIISSTIAVMSPFVDKSFRYDLPHFITSILSSVYWRHSWHTLSDVMINHAWVNRNPPLSDRSTAELVQRLPFYRVTTTLMLHPAMMHRVPRPF